MKTPGPDHPITIAPLQGRVSVEFNVTLVARSDNALTLKEATYPPVIYIPRLDISVEHYTPSAHQTHCPYKGDAGYFNLVADGKVAQNAVWTYEQPYPAVKAIEGHVAFYTDKVTIDVR